MSNLSLPYALFSSVKGNQSSNEDLVMNTELLQSLAYNVFEGEQLDQVMRPSDSVEEGETQEAADASGAAYLIRRHLKNYEVKLPLIHQLSAIETLLEVMEKLQVEPEKGQKTFIELIKCPQLFEF